MTSSESKPSAESGAKLDPSEILRRARAEKAQKKGTETSEDVSAEGTSENTSNGSFSSDAPQGEEERIRKIIEAVRAEAASRSTGA